MADDTADQSLHVNRCFDRKFFFSLILFRIFRPMTSTGFFLFFFKESAAPRVLPSSPPRRFPDPCPALFTPSRVLPSQSDFRFGSITSVSATAASRSDRARQAPFRDSGSRSPP